MPNLRLTFDKGLILAVLALSGCSTFDPDYYCTQRNEVRCIAWQFGPSKQQREDFDRRAK